MIDQTETPATFPQPIDDLKIAELHRRINRQSKEIDELRNSVDQQANGDLSLEESEDIAEQKQTYEQENNDSVENELIVRIEESRRKIALAKKQIETAEKEQQEARAKLENLRTKQSSEVKNSATPNLDHQPKLSAHEIEKSLHEPPIDAEATREIQYHARVTEEIINETLQKNTPAKPKQNLRTSFSDSTTALVEKLITMSPPDAKTLLTAENIFLGMGVFFIFLTFVAAAAGVSLWSLLFIVAILQIGTGTLLKLKG